MVIKIALKITLLISLKEFINIILHIKQCFMNLRKKDYLQQVKQDALLSGVESRTSSPVRITRDSELLSNIQGVYPCGEGAGYAGGITSAAMDGIKIAETISKKYRNF